MDLYSSIIYNTGVKDIVPFAKSTKILATKIERIARLVNIFYAI